jgi:PTH1 family peptidyl-tRNA hydrolase
MKLIVGLGNPGAEYAGTRHNAGFEVIEILAKRHQIAVSKRNFQAVYGDGAIGGQRVILARPMTYMNLSGEATTALMRFYKIEPEDTIIILDEVALPPGRLRLRFQGSAGGHNGLANILQLLHTDRVPRIRIGVGASRTGQMIGHVLSRFPKEEFPIMQQAYDLAADAIECALSEGFEIAMNRFNIREKAQTKEEP